MRLWIGLGNLDNEYGAYRLKITPLIDFIEDLKAKGFLKTNLRMGMVRVR